MSTAFKRKFNVNGIEVTDNLKLGDTTVSSLVDSSITTSVATSSSVSLSIVQNAGNPSAKIYDSAELLPGTEDSGAMALVTETNRLYIWNGTGWYNIALINNSPVITTSPDSNYSIESPNSASITIAATDSEGLPISFTSTASDSASNFVTITQDSNGDSSTFTVTALAEATIISNGFPTGGTFTITFKASDGVNVVPKLSNFTITIAIVYNPGISIELQKVAADDAQTADYYGFDVDISGDGNYAIVGAYGEDTTASAAGSAYILYKASDTWTQQAKIQASDASSSDNFGYSVAISKDGNYAIVGAKAAPATGAGSSGAAYVFIRSGTTWTQQAKLENTSTPGPVNGDWFGVSVALSSNGTYAVVGSHNKTENGSGSGVAYVFVRSSTTWTLQQKILGSTVDASDYYGFSVDINDDGDRVVVGAYGKSRAFAWSRSGTTWTETKILEPSQATSSERFGRGVAISGDGNTIAVGASREVHSSTTRPGAGYVFVYGDHNYDVENATHDHSSATLTQDTNPSACLFNGDGTKVYLFGYTGDKIYQYTLSTAYDVSSSSLSYDGSSSDITLSNISGDGTGARWNNDGTKLFIIDKTNDRLHQYSLSTAYDVDTMSHDGYFSLTGSTGDLFGFDFNNDGTKFYVVDRTNDRVDQYRMTKPYDYTSAVYDSVNVTVTTDPFSIAFNSTGTVFFISDDDGTASIYAYECETAWDISNATQIYSFAVNGQEIYPKQITFNPDGSKMFLVGNDSDQIQRYDTQTANTWYQQVRVIASNSPRYGAELGNKAAITSNGNQVYFTADRDQTAGGVDNAGATYAYTRVGSNWAESNILYASNRKQSQHFGDGIAVTAAGQYVLVGSGREDQGGNINNDYGAVYFFENFEKPDFVWNNRREQIQLQSSDAASSDYFGWSTHLSTDGNVGAVGAPNENSSDGALYVFSRSAGTWSQAANLNASDETSTDDAQMGISCSVSGDGKYAVAGAPYARSSLATLDVGAAYVFNDSKYNIGASSLVHSSAAISEDTFPNGLLFNADGTKAYIAGDTNDSVFQYSLSTAFDVTSSSMSYDNVSLDISGGDIYSETNNVWGMRWNDDGTKLFVVCRDRDDVVAYDLTTAYDISTGSYNNEVLDVSSQDGNPAGLFFKPDGTKMYLVGYSNDSVYQYTLSTAYDVSTASYDSVSFSVASQDTTPDDVAFTPDGTRMFIVGDTNNGVYQYSLSTAWDVSTAQYDGISYTDLNEGSPRQIVFDNDGSHYFIIGRSSDRIRKISCSGWAQLAKLDNQTSQVNDDKLGMDVDITNDGEYVIAGDPGRGSSGVAWIFKKYGTGYAGYTTTPQTYLEASDASSRTNSEAGNAVAINKDDGTIALVGAPNYYSGRGAVWVYSRSGSTWTEISKIQHEVNDQSSSDKFGVSVGLSADGNTAIVGAHQYDLPSKSNSGSAFVYEKQTAGYSLYNMSYDSVASDSINSQESSPTSILFNNDGTKVYILGYTSDRIHQYSLSTPYDITSSSMSYDDVSYDFTETGIPQEMKWNDDGTKIFVCDRSDRYIFEYNLSTAYDVSTISYSNNSYYISQSTLPQGFDFNGDGTKMFVACDGTDYIYQYSLSTAYSLASVTYDNVYFNHSSQTSGASGLIFSPDGKKLFIVSDSSNKVWEYHLPVAYDLSTMYHATEPSYGILVSSQDSGPNGIAFNADGTKMFIVGMSTDKIYRYSTGGVSWIRSASGWLQPDDIAASDYFGEYVAISDDGKTVTAASRQWSSKKGKFYIWQKASDGSWQQMGDNIQASNAGTDDQFGRGLSISGDGGTILSGANQEDTTAGDAGSAYVFITTHD